jgi:hypothetical protein
MATVKRVADDEVSLSGGQRVAVVSVMSLLFGAGILLRTRLVSGDPYIECLAPAVIGAALAFIVGGASVVIHARTRR